MADYLIGEEVDSEIVEIDADDIAQAIALKEVMESPEIVPEVALESEVAEVVEEVKKKKSKNNYFNEEQAKEWIFKLQETAKFGEDRDGLPILVWKDTAIEHKITVEVLKVVKAVIQVYRDYIFEPYDDCVQHGIMNCYQNYFKYHPSKGSAFNFFSIIAKRSLLNYTDRRKKHRNHSDISEQVGIKARKHLNFDYFLDDLQKTLVSIVSENYEGKKKVMFLKITAILCDYLFKTKKFIGKSDFYTWCRSYGIRSIDVREFIKEMNEHHSELYFGIDEIEEQVLAQEDDSCMEIG